MKHSYDNWFQNEESDHATSRKYDKEESADLSDMSPVEGNEEVKERKRLKTLIYQLDL